jgi:protein-disulfide isomerase
MSSPDQMRKMFLLGSIVVGVLVIVGLVYAIASGSGPATGPNFDDTNDPVFGAQTDKVVRIFGDFQCPACRAAEPMVKQMMLKYSDKIRFVWNDFPLQAIHPNALPAANAARCAQDQNKFWEYHDRLYEDQPVWGSLSNPRQKFLDYGNALGLNNESFEKCYDGRDNQAKIMDDIREGDRNNVGATPTFFVGTKQLVGGTDVATWESAIQALLAQPSASTTSTP